MDWQIVSPDHVYVEVNEHVRFDAFRLDRPKWCAMLWAVAYSYDGVVIDTVTTGEPVDAVRNWWKFIEEVCNGCNGVESPFWCSCGTGE